MLCVTHHLANPVNLAGPSERVERPGASMLHTDQRHTLLSKKTLGFMKNKLDGSMCSLPQTP